MNRQWMVKLLINCTRCHVWKNGFLMFGKLIRSRGFPVLNTGLFISHVLSSMTPNISTSNWKREGFCTMTPVIYRIASCFSFSRLDIFILTRAKIQN